MRILVTGANGFIGNALCQHLALLRHDVVRVVRRQSQIASDIIIQNEESWNAALNGCDSLIHLAALTNPIQENKRNLLQVFRENNLDTTIELAKRAREAGVRRFVFMSTIKVNGEQTAPRCSFRPEDSISPKDPYAISKWEAEKALLEISKLTGLEVVIVRPPIVYGPGVKGNFASLVKWVKHGIPLPLGAIQNSRSMIGLDNLVSFTALCADFDASPYANGQIYLVSDGEDISTAELSRRIAKAYKCKAHLISVPEGLIRLTARCFGKEMIVNRLLGSLVVDDSKARQMLGWHPQLSIDEQLMKMAQYDSVT